MDITAPVTDYIPDSILTIRGDLLKRGVVDAERFPRGNSKEVLRVTDSGLDLQYDRLVNSIYRREYHIVGTLPNIITTAGRVLVSLGYIDVTIGSRIVVASDVHFVKGASAGNMYFFVQKQDGTADIVTFVDSVQLEWKTWCEALTDYMMGIYGVFRVVNTGTLRLCCYGQSFLSASEIVEDGPRLSITVID